MRWKHQREKDKKAALQNEIRKSRNKLRLVNILGVSFKPVTSMFKGHAFPSQSQMLTDRQTLASNKAEKICYKIFKATDRAHKKSAPTNEHIFSVARLKSAHKNKLRSLL